jgi:hypothetical protein
MRPKIIAGVLMLCLISSCKKDDCVEQTLIAKHLESEYGCSNTKYTLNINLINSCTIVRDKVGFDTLLSGACHPNIDFAQYDLIIGRQSLVYLNDSIRYVFSTSCPGNELSLLVAFKQTSLTGPDNVVYHALIPKLGDNEILTVKLKIE